METAAGRGRAVPRELIYDVMRSAVAQLEFTPVFLGSAYRNKGVQPLLDAVVRLLPSPLDCRHEGVRQGRRRPARRRSSLTPDPDKPTVAMAFKMVEDPYGTLTFMRIYQGRFVKGGTLLQPAHRPQGAVQPHRADARRPARGHRRGPGRRHRGRAGRRLRQRRHLRLRTELLPADA